MFLQIAKMAYTAVGVGDQPPLYGLEP